jgi:hypothetical protein
VDTRDYDGYFTRVARTQAIVHDRTVVACYTEPTILSITTVYVGHRLPLQFLISDFSLSLLKPVPLTIRDALPGLDTRQL